MYTYVHVYVSLDGGDNISFRLPQHHNTHTYRHALLLRTTKRGMSTCGTLKSSNVVANAGLLGAFVSGRPFTWRAD